MSGYVPREREPISREQTVALVAGVLTSIFLFISVIAASRWATPLLMKLNFGILPLGILQYVLGVTYLVPHKGKPPERPLAKDIRSRRITAVMCFILGTLIVAVSIMGHGSAR